MAERASVRGPLSAHAGLRGEGHAIASRTPVAIGALILLAVPRLWAQPTLEVEAPEERYPETGEAWQRGPGYRGGKGDRKGHTLTPERRERKGVRSRTAVQRKPSEVSAEQAPLGTREHFLSATLDSLESGAPDPSSESLDAVLAATRSVRVLRDGTDAGVPIGDEALFETEDRGALASLRDALQIVDGPAGLCMCYGDPTIELFDGDGDRMAVIGLHHGRSIRWDGWREDAALSDGVRLLEWLAFQGISYPLDEYRHQRAGGPGRPHHRAHRDGPRRDADRRRGTDRGRKLDPVPASRRELDGFAGRRSRSTFRRDVP